MTKAKVTSPKAASSASRTLSSTSAAPKSKTVVGCALSQTLAPQKVTSPKAATAASKVLSDGRTGKDSKIAAGSALAQRPSKGKK
jgi:hypothetical protein